eukprot:g7132.t1
MLSNNGIIQPESTIIIDKPITISGFHDQELGASDDTYPASKKKTVVTCPKNTTQGIFNIKSGGVIIANLEIRDCLNPQKASPIVIGECNNNTDGVQIHHVDFMNNSGRSQPVTIDTLPGHTSCGALEMTDVLFQGNKAGNEAVFVRLQSKTNMKDIRLKNNQPEDVTEQGNSFFLFTSTQKENNSLSIDNLDATRNSVPIIEARVGIINILRSVFKKNKVNIEDNEIKQDASMIQFLSTSKVTIRDCSFNDSAGKGQGLILSDNVSSIEIHESNFSQNSEFGSVIFSTDSLLHISASTFVSNNGTISGGVLHLENSTATIKKSTYTNNTSSESGGAIYAFKISKIRVRESTFIQNSAREGGCFHIEESDVTITKSIFRNNEADVDGGAIRLERGGVICRHSTFTHNTASDDGGAFNIESATYVNWTGVRFSYNRATFGSSARIVKCKNDVLWKDVDFQNSTVGLTGAAAYIDDSNVTIDGAFFQNLTAPYGGALYAQSFDIIIKNAIFKNNHALVMGGAMSGEIGNIAIKNTTFIDNRSILGGALHFFNSTFNASEIRFLNNTGSEGAGLLFKDSNVSIGPWPGVKGNIPTPGESSFSFGIFTFNNTGIDSGGVIAAKESNLNISYGAFIDNSAPEGGAIQVTSTEDNSFSIRDSLFEGNVADIRGGGIAARTSDGDLSANLSSVQFKKCIADEGGAIFFTSVNAVIENCTFDSNAAAGGGAVFIRKSRTILSNKETFKNRSMTQIINVTVKNCYFIGNKADTRGGAIMLRGELLVNRQFMTIGNGANGYRYAEDGFNVEIESVNFSNNRVYTEGGAIYGRAINLIMHNATVMDNNANEGGGAYLVQTLFSISDSKIIGNQAVTGGGGIKMIIESNGLIYSTMFIGNEVTKQGYGGGLSMSGCTTKAQSLHMENNSAAFGGGVSLTYELKRNSTFALDVVNSRFLCLNCNFTNNNASTSGGALNINHQNSNITVVAQLENCSFKGNSAEVFGGGIHFGRLDDHIKQENWTATGYLVILNSTFTNNTAGRSGGSLISYDRFKVLAQCSARTKNTQVFEFLNTTEIRHLHSNNKSYCLQWTEQGTITNQFKVSTYMKKCRASIVNDDDRNRIRSRDGQINITVPGQIFPHIFLNCYDQFNNTAKSDRDGFTATLKSKQKGHLQGIYYYANLDDGTGNFTGTNNPSTEYGFDEAYTSQLEISFNLDYVQSIIVGMNVRECKINENKKKQNEGIVCEKCDAKQYNFNPMTETCKPCDDTLDCSGTFVHPSKNYWHSSPCHAPAQKCLTTNACEKAVVVDIKMQERKEEYKNIRYALDQYSCFISETARKEYQKLLCKQGYEGVLCGSCNKKYGRSLSFACTKCNGTGHSVLVFGFVCVWLALIAGIAIKGSMTIEERLSVIKKQMMDQAVKKPLLLVESLPKKNAENDNSTILEEKTNKQVNNNVTRFGLFASRLYQRIISSISRLRNSSYSVGRKLPTDAEEETIIDTSEKIKNLKLAQLAKWKLCEVFKVTINFLQSIAVAAVINVEWTRYMLTMFNISAFTGGESTALLTRAIHCFPWWNGTEYATYVGLVSGLLVPIFVVLCIVAFFAFLAYKLSKGMYYFVKRSVLATLAISYFSYLSITKVAVMFFYCVGVHTDEEFSSTDETYYWALDTSIQCSASYHKKLKVFGGILFALFSVGFPLVSASVLVLFRKDSGQKDPQWMSDILGFLYRAYRRKFVYWESIVMLRKALLSVIAVFSYHLGGHTQSLLASYILSVCLFLQAICKPYRDEFESLNIQESLSLLVSGTTFTLVQFFMKDRTDHSFKLFLNLSLMFAIVGFLSYMILSMMICLLDVRKTNLKVTRGLAAGNKSFWSAVSDWISSKFRFGERVNNDHHTDDVELGSIKSTKEVTIHDMSDCSL